MQKLHFLFKLILILNCYSIYAGTELPVAGTPTRLEEEYKFAFKYPKGVSIRDIRESIHEELTQMLKSNELQFNKFLQSPYSVTKETKTFIFKDYYLDDSNYNLYKNGADYRLRYRWSSYTTFFGFNFFPYLKFFYPNRCEIQFKHGYKRKEHPNLVSAFETRFEFRNESTPFSKKQDAPAPPWSYDEFIHYAQSGYYKNVYTILPFKRAKELFSKLENLERVTPVTTVRYRDHLHIKSPWGSGPNPTQAFIISFDLVQYKGKEQKRFIEIEIEMERNISTLLNTFANPPKKAFQTYFKDDELKEAKSISKKAKSILKKDQNLIAMRLYKLLSQKFKLRPLATKNKYHRVIKDIMR